MAQKKKTHQSKIKTLLDRHRALPRPKFTDESPKDRLFEILMEHFDLLNKDRKGYRPVLYTQMLPHMQDFLDLVFARARITPPVCGKPFYMLGLALVYASAVRAWEEDETRDMAKTMARIDLRLGQADEIAGMLPFLFRQES